MESNSDSALAVAFTTAEVAWVLVLVMCVFLMVAPFVFWAVVMVTRRREQHAAPSERPVAQLEPTFEAEERAS